MARSDFFILACLTCFIWSGAFADTVLRDPTMPSKYTDPAVATAISEGKVEMIYVSPVMTYAIIDGKSYKVGDEWEKKKIIRIEYSAVYLKTTAGETKLTLFPDVKSVRGEKN